MDSGDGCKKFKARFHGSCYFSNFVKFKFILEQVVVLKKLEFEERQSQDNYHFVILRRTRQEFCFDILKPRRRKRSQAIFVKLEHSRKMNAILIYMCFGVYKIIWVSVSGPRGCHHRNLPCNYCLAGRSERHILQKTFTK